MKNFGLFVLAIIFGILMGLLQAYIILRVSEMYTLNFITELGFLKIYGLVGIMQLVAIKVKDLESNDDGADEALKRMFNAIFMKLVLLGVFFAVSFLMISLLK
jgi:hypothetical protein